MAHTPPDASATPGSYPYKVQRAGPAAEALYDELYAHLIGETGGPGIDPETATFMIMTSWDVVWNAAQASRHGAAPTDY